MYNKASLGSGNLITINKPIQVTCTGNSTEKLTWVVPELYISLVVSVAG